jgi:hypothetical protein
MHPRVKGVEVLPPYGLRLTFRDGSSGIDVDLDPTRSMSWRTAPRRRMRVTRQGDHMVCVKMMTLSADRTAIV